MRNAAMINQNRLTTGIALQGSECLNVKECGELKGSPRKNENKNVGCLEKIFLSGKIRGKLIFTVPGSLPAASDDLLKKMIGRRSST